MPHDYYAEGYQQAAQDFAQGKGYKPHDMGNLLKLVTTSDKNNDAFLKGYRAGYDYCAQKKLEQYAREAIRANPGNGRASRSAPNFSHSSRHSRPGFRQTPENEPDY